MSPVAAGIIGTIIAFLLLFLGMPIALALMLVGFLGIWYLSSLGAALPIAARTVYSVAAHYPYTVIPLFIIMGGFASSGGLVGELYISVIFIIYILLSCFMDAISMMVLTIPVIFPLILELGFDPIWLCAYDGGRIDYPAYRTKCVYPCWGSKGCAGGGNLPQCFTFLIPIFLKDKTPSKLSDELYSD